MQAPDSPLMHAEIIRLACEYLLTISDEVLAQRAPWLTRERIVWVKEHPYYRPDKDARLMKQLVAMLRHEHQHCCLEE